MGVSGRRRATVAVVGLLALATACSRGTTSSRATSVSTSTSAGAAPTSTTTAPCVPVGTGAPRTDQSPPPIAAIQVVGADAAWAVGASLIVHTGDGGRSWKVQYSGPDPLISVDMVDASHGWAAGPSGLVATDDGGGCWSRRSTPSPAIHAVHFVDPNMGWAVAAASDPISAVPNTGGILERTTDGGRTWARQTAPDNVQTVCFTDARQGWLTAAGQLQATADGGAHWTAVPLATARGEQWKQAQVQCAPGVAWVLATGGGAAGHVAHAVYRVPVGGPAVAVFAESNTHPVDAPADHGTYPGPLSVIGPSAAVMAGFTPALSPGKAAILTVAVDSGRTISPATAPVPEIVQPTGASFSSPDAGWVVGELPGQGVRPGLIARTTDGGRTWTVQYRTS